MIPAYLRLSPKGSAFARLVILKNSAAYTNAPDVCLPPSRRFATWREARTENFRTLSPSLSQGFNDSDNGPLAPKRAVWFSHNDDNFRDERTAHEIVRSIGHTGWFTDADQSRTACGIVGRLTHGRFIAGYVDNDTGERVYFDRVYDDETEAANAADSEAERYAEKEREYAERYQAASVARDDLEEAKKDIADWWPLRNQSRRVRADLYSAIERAKIKRNELENEFSDIEF